MAKSQKAISTNHIKDLGDGLVLRRATRQDASALADFDARIHSDDGPDKPDERARAWVLDLVDRPHPTFEPGDFTIVEQTSSGKIVSSMNLISQTWSYGGIEFGVGRPELVGTDPEFRNRGLVRAQFETIHEWSAARGHKLQGITGIPYYYRLFGYEMAMDLGGGRVSFKRFVPKLKEGEQEPFRVRPAMESDLNFIAGLYQLGGKRYLVNSIRDAALWRYELLGRSSQNVNRQEICLVETPDGEPVAYLIHAPFVWTTTVVAHQYEVKPGVSWSKVTPSVLRYLLATGEAQAAEAGRQADFDGFAFWFGREHPAYGLLHEGLPRVRKPYAWYLRVPDLVDFIRHVAPALEGHLAASLYEGYTGDLKLTFYHKGLLLGFANGRLERVENYTPTPVGHSGNAGFPGMTFLQLLFGYRTLEELSYAFADCWYENDEVFGLLTALFPKRPCNLWPIS